MHRDRVISSISDLGPHATGVGSLGIVAIGRNEGERLRHCLESVHGLADAVVYVDSGSSDGSVAIARGFASTIVELDLSTPFTAARARNEGFQELLAILPHVEHVFFVDGDCEVVADWLTKGVKFLANHPDVAVVWGLRRERYPNTSVYNMLCDIEWQDHPIGETKYCGGDALIRVASLRQVKGYRPDLICGEEPELCVRLRQAGWRIWHLNEQMTIHDAAISSFYQWWRRMLRGGYGFAQASAIHGAPPERHGVIESRRAWLWGFIIPLLTIFLFAIGGSWALLLVLAYPLQILRLALNGKRNLRMNSWRAAALVVSKFPEVLGQMKYLLDCFRRTQSRLIEYK